MAHEVPYLDESTARLHALCQARILYTDLDGTLLARGGSVLADAEGEPSARVAEAIVAANRNGIAIVPVSGRGRIQLIELTRLLGWRSFIAEAGGVTVRETDEGAETILNIGQWSRRRSGARPHPVRDHRRHGRSRPAPAGLPRPHRVPHPLAPQPRDHACAPGLCVPRGGTGRARRHHPSHRHRRQRDHP